MKDMNKTETTAFEPREIVKGVEALENKFKELERRYRELMLERDKVYQDLDMTYTRLMMEKTGIAAGSTVVAVDRSGKSFRGIFRGWNYGERYTLVRVTPLKRNGEISQNVRLVDARDMKLESEAEA